jgi:hypothetical protein
MKVQVIRVFRVPELSKINSGFASCYPKFSNEIRVSGISDSSIPSSDFSFFSTLTSPEVFFLCVSLGGYTDNWKLQLF